MPAGRRPGAGLPLPPSEGTGWGPSQWVTKQGRAPPPRSTGNRGPRLTSVPQAGAEETMGAGRGGNDPEGSRQTHLQQLVRGPTPQSEGRRPVVPGAGPFRLLLRPQAHHSQGRHLPEAPSPTQERLGCAFQDGPSRLVGLCPVL